MAENAVIRTAVYQLSATPIKTSLLGGGVCAALLMEHVNKIEGADKAVCTQKIKELHKLDF